jgi:hypothetical protein
VDGDRFFDLRAPDGVTGDVEIAHDEAAHRSKQLRDRACPVPSFGSGDREPLPVESGIDGLRAEAERNECLLVLGLTEHGHVSRKKSCAGVV